RRQAITTSAALLGGMYLGTRWLTGCTPGKHPDLFSPETAVLLNQVGETIIPATTGSPGASAAHIGEFMQVMVADCYDEAHQKAFTDGVHELTNKNFMDLSQVAQIEFLLLLEKEALKYNEDRIDHSPKHYFSLMKDLTMQGYFSSEVGATTALRHVPIPGRYNGCVDYVAGTPAWANQG
ncbi:MAG TPA: gluconate 2-dehydrogenase subunit 3 family protein, partial [Cyclobacteriaceae bacterium]|nr:gluconate 2-dehydrogenase subunit 3 family protein [Cyclobacteriaceae bacterium]